MRKLQSEVAIYQTARNAYITALKVDIEQTKKDDGSQKKKVDQH